MEVLIPLIAVVPGTVIVQTAFFDPDLTVIFAIPTPTAFILPFLSTVATFLLDVEYFTFFQEASGFKVAVLPLAIVIADGIAGATVGTGVNFGIFLFSVFPHLEQVRCCTPSFDAEAFLTIVQLPHK